MYNNSKNYNNNYYYYFRIIRNKDILWTAAEIVVPNASPFWAKTHKQKLTQIKERGKELRCEGPSKIV